MLYGVGKGDDDDDKGDSYSVGGGPFPRRPRSAYSQRKAISICFVPAACNSRSGHLEVDRHAKLNAFNSINESHRACSFSISRKRRLSLDVDKEELANLYCFKD